MGVRPPSEDLAASVAQCDTTLDTANATLGSMLIQRDADGLDTDIWAADCWPRSLLVVESLSQFEQQGKTNLPQFENFECFRYTLRDPEVVTFDELCLRASLALEIADSDADRGAHEVAETHWPPIDDAAL